MYVPELPVVAVRACPVERLVTVTVALGITAPEESFTVPVNAPVVADSPENYWSHHYQQGNHC